MRKRLLVLVLLLSGCSMAPITPRPDSWAQPITVKHLTNFYKVSDNLYRSAQPDLLGMEEAKTLGIKTVIDLQEDPHQDPIVPGLRYEHIPQYAWNIKNENIIWFLALINNPQNGPFLVHCLHGSDRTGAACAMYRIVFQGWTKKDTIQEMEHGGYGFHWIWMNIPEYIEDVDVQGIRKMVDLNTTSAGTAKP